jgi:hypothetical protein
MARLGGWLYEIFCSVFPIEEGVKYPSTYREICAPTKPNLAWMLYTHMQRTLGLEPSFALKGMCCFFGALMVGPNLHLQGVKH